MKNSVKKTNFCRGFPPHFTPLTPRTKNRHKKTSLKRLVSQGFLVAREDLNLRPPTPHDGMTDFARLMGQSFITRDGEAIEGEDVEVFGVVTFTVNDQRRDDCPV